MTTKSKNSKPKNRKQKPAKHPDPDATLQDERYVDTATGEILEPRKTAEQIASEIAAQIKSDEANKLVNAPIFIDSCYVESVKADLVARSVKVVLTLPLNQNFLTEIRERLALTAAGEIPCNVTIARKQMQAL